MEADLDELDVDYDVDMYMYEAGQTILQGGDNSAHACKLVSGTAKVLRSGDVVATLQAGEYFGAIAAITGKKRAATVVASERCVVEHINKHKFRLMLQTDPDLLNKIK